MNEVNQKLIDAARFDYFDDLKDALKKGADVNTKDEDNRTLLHWAAFQGYIKIVKLLIENKADINARDNKGYTPLLDAAFKGNIDIANLLISKGADVNARDDNGSTPLSWAVEYNRIDIVRLLINKNADIGIADNIGCTAIDYADENKKEYMENIFKEKVKRKEYEKQKKQREKEAKIKAAEEAERKKQAKLEEEKKVKEKLQHKKEFLENISKGFKHISENKFPEALKLLRDIGFPEDEIEKIEILKLKSKIFEGYNRIDNQQEALVELIKMLEFKENNFEYFYNLATIYEANGKLLEAISIYKNFINNLYLDYKDVGKRYDKLQQKLSSPEVKAKLASPPKPITVVMDALSEKSESLKERIDRLSDQNSYYTESVFINKVSPINIDTPHSVDIKELYDKLKSIIEVKGQKNDISLEIIQITTKYQDVKKDRNWIVIRPVSNPDLLKLRLGIDIIKAPGMIAVDIYTFLVPQDPKKDQDVKIYNNSYYTDISLAREEKDSNISIFTKAVTDMVKSSLTSVVEGKGEVRF